MKPAAGTPPRAYYQGCSRRRLAAVNSSTFIFTTFLQRMEFTHTYLAFVILCSSSGFKLLVTIKERNKPMTTKSISLETPKRYHPALASIHWVIAFLIFANVILASVAEGEGGHVPGTIFGLPVIGIHMLTGITILVLLSLRLIARWRTPRPELATAGHPLLDLAGVLNHYALYLFTFSMAITGILMAWDRGYFARIFGIGSDAAGPSLLDGLHLGALHGLSWLFLAFFIFLHVSAALYHQFIRKDHLLSRMWLGR